MDLANSDTAGGGVGVDIVGAAGKGGGAEWGKGQVTGVDVCGHGRWVGCLTLVLKP